MNVVTDMNFTPYHAERYTQKHECPKCKGMLTVTLMEGCSNSFEISCRQCGRKKYLFEHEKADSSIKLVVNKPTGPKKFKTMPCMCHKVLGGPPCNVTFQTKAGNALYCPEHSKAAKDRVNKIKRERESGK